MARHCIASRHWDHGHTFVQLAVDMLHRKRQVYGWLWARDTCRHSLDSYNYAAVGRSIVPHLYVPLAVHIYPAVYRDQLDRTTANAGVGRQGRYISLPTEKAPEGVHVCFLQGTSCVVKQGSSLLSWTNCCFLCSIIQNISGPCFAECNGACTCVHVHTPERHPWLNPVCE